MYALVEIKGKQYKLEKGSVLQVDKLEGDAGSDVEFDSVLMTSDEAGVNVGAPYVKNAKVTATIEDHTKGDKVTIIKYKRRKGYRRKQGHRQQYSVIKVKDIVGA
ncbi:50S ribosomal protein L21 [Marispirochaeta aestuarii]|jgi:large subunit ribosomal protein L21|uniref:Large ribosomal subunit protein bL21 n=1 Tax=Marispirochaeta aestuarii TaxID=1963862 RepID=A0A1Y1S190_9SPIO|nr:50S ribosomal protein L21 [Marispirochaeta aestuarii]ORC37197.1 50S ribosomal protein L21 [Marispirochaeta aestuarii]